MGIVTLQTVDYEQLPSATKELAKCAAVGTLAASLAAPHAAPLIAGEPHEDSPHPHQDSSELPPAVGRQAIEFHSSAASFIMPFNYDGSGDVIRMRHQWHATRTRAAINASGSTGGILTLV
jgi:hypothetical protein